LGNEIEKQNKVNIPLEWAPNKASMDAINTMNVALKSSGKHGLASGIPIICKVEQCPYYETCPVKVLGAEMDGLRGQRCPVEISKIMNKFEEYTSEFGIDMEYADPIITSLIKELIDYDIQIERADAVMASDGHFLADVIVGVDANGRPIKNKEVSKPVDYKERAVKKRHEILNLLNSTPKDKAGKNLTVTFDPSSYASKLLQRAKDLQDAGIIDADYEVLED
jgi:hypothetical protein